MFELTPNSTKTKWTHKVLYSFCAQTDCADGSLPNEGLIMDGAGNFYGTASAGGANGGSGTVFKLAPNATTGQWTEAVLYSFCTQSSCTDGANPYGDLVMDRSGNLYGTTYGGGSSLNYGLPGSFGTVFDLMPSAAAGPWTHKVLYNFCVQGGGSGCSDGFAPHAGLIMDGLGNLYGTTYFGGAGCEEENGSGCGVVFRLVPDAGGTKWTENVLFAFCVESNCSRCLGLNAGVIMDGSGNLYVRPLGAADRGIAFKRHPTSPKEDGPRR